MILDHFVLYWEKIKVKLMILEVLVFVKLFFSAF